MWAVHNGGMEHRKLGWDGFYNARDLGGLPRIGGGETKFGRFARSADLRFVTDQGLDALGSSGFQTVVDLRNDFETRLKPRNENEAQANAHRVPPTPEPSFPDGIFGVRVPLDATGDIEFWKRLAAEGRIGSPRFFSPVIKEQPHRVVAVLRAIAASPGGVLYHCAIGRDRTGLLTFALLALAEVEPSAIAEDYALSARELGPFFRRLDFPDRAEVIAARLAEQGYTIESAVAEQLEEFDPWADLIDAGMTEAELISLRARLVE